MIATYKTWSRYALAAHVLYRIAIDLADYGWEYNLHFGESPFLEVFSDAQPEYIIRAIPVEHGVLFDVSVDEAGTSDRITRIPLAQDASPGDIKSLRGRVLRIVNEEGPNIDDIVGRVQDNLREGWDIRPVDDPENPDLAWVLVRDGAEAPEYLLEFEFDAPGPAFYVSTWNDGENGCSCCGDDRPDWDVFASDYFPAGTTEDDTVWRDAMNTLLSALPCNRS